MRTIKNNFLTFYLGGCYFDNGRPDVMEDVSDDGVWFLNNWKYGKKINSSVWCNWVEEFSVYGILLRGEDIKIIYLGPPSEEALVDEVVFVHDIPGYLSDRWELVKA